MVDLRIALVSAITAMTGGMDRNKDHLSPSGGEHPEGHHGGTSGDCPHYGSQKDRREKRDHEKRDLKKTVVQALIVGVIMGFYNSLFGPGIGTVAIIAFMMIMHYDARCASGNGKVLIVLTNAIALVSYVKTGNVAYEIACPAALCAIAGNLVGVNLAIRKGEKIIKPVMLVVVILTVIKFAWQNHLWG